MSIAQNDLNAHKAGELRNSRLPLTIMAVLSKLSEHTLHYGDQEEAAKLVAELWRDAQERLFWKTACEIAIETIVRQRTELRRGSAREPQ